MTTSGAPLAITLDGVHLLGVSPQDVTFRPADRVTHREAADGSVRESRPWVDTGQVAKRVRYTVVLDYRHARDEAPLIDRLLSTPGEHRLVAWKHEADAHESDGVQQVYTLPRTLAQDALDDAGDPLSPPGGHPWSRFAVRVRLGSARAGALEPLAVSQAAWDAGDPPTGTVWRLTGSPQIKLAPADVPLAGEYLYTESVPELRLVQAAPPERSYRSPLLEPRRLELRET